jgi:hypothetical protein
MKPHKKFYIVYWSEPSGYSEFTELYTKESDAYEAAERYQITHDTLVFSVDTIELIK